MGEGLGEVDGNGEMVGDADAAGEDEGEGESVGSASFASLPPTPPPEDDPPVCDGVEFVLLGVPSVIEDVYHTRVDSLRSIVLRLEAFPACHFVFVSASMMPHAALNRYSFSPSFANVPVYIISALIPGIEVSSVRSSRA